MDFGKSRDPLLGSNENIAIGKSGNKLSPSGHIWLYYLRSRDQTKSSFVIAVLTRTLFCGNRHHIQGLVAKICSSETVTYTVEQVEVFFVRTILIVDFELF